MKKRFLFTSFAFALLILVSIGLQSLHSFRHINDFLSEKKCNHHYAIDKTVVSHQHHQLDHCFSCEFTFSGYLFSDYQLFTFYKADFVFLQTTFYAKKITHFFKGSLFQLRAPPRFIF